jgi:hypothetical protein
VPARYQRVAHDFRQQLARRFVAHLRQLLYGIKHVIVDVERRPHPTIITHHASDVK